MTKKELNAWGVLLKVKRKWFESDLAYNARLRDAHNIPALDLIVNCRCVSWATTPDDRVNGGQ